MRAPDANPLVLATVVALLAEGVAARRTFGQYPRPPMSIDAAFFQHAGWYVTTGAVPYVDVWDVKPPLAFLVPTVFAHFTRNPYRLHLLATAFMVGVMVGCVVLVVALARHVTGDSSSGLVAGLSMLALPAFHYRPLLGYKPKYLIVFTGLLGLYLYFRGHPVLSGMAVAAAVGFRPPAVIYPLLVLGLAIHRGDRRGVPMLLAGMTVTTVLYVAPIVYWGGTVPMVVQAGIAPLVSSPGGYQKPLYMLSMGVANFRYGSVVVLLAGYGAWRFLGSDAARTEWWVVAGAVWYASIVVFVDFDSYAYGDLIPGLPFVALLVGYLHSTLPDRRRRRALGGVLGAVVLVNVVALGGVGLLFEPHPAAEPIDVDGPPPTIHEDASTVYPPAPETIVDARYVYWHQLRPETCHYRFGNHELRWIHRSGRYPSCGEDLDEAIGLLMGG